MCFSGFGLRSALRTKAGVGAWAFVKVRAGCTLGPLWTSLSLQLSECPLFQEALLSLGLL